MARPKVFERPRPASNGMRILIGTPIHICKDYAMERWLKSVSELVHPHDLMMVDNSPDASYLEKVRGYCKKFGITDYKLARIGVDQGLCVDGKISYAREIIRQEILTKGYDAWCTLECDVIAPPNALDELVRLIGDFVEVNHSYPCRQDPDRVDYAFGLSLVKREALEKYGFIGQYGHCDPEAPDCWHGGESWFMRRVLMGGDKYINVFGIIGPVFHLSR